jgi:hypothetical protein
MIYDCSMCLTTLYPLIRSSSLINFPGGMKEPVGRINHFIYSLINLPYILNEVTLRQGSFTREILSVLIWPSPIVFRFVLIYLKVSCWGSFCSQIYNANRRIRFFHIGISRVYLVFHSALQPMVRPILQKHSQARHHETALSAVQNNHFGYMQGEGHHGSPACKDNY